MNIKSIKLKKYTDKKNVSLTPVYLNKLSKFKIKRLFILDGKINVIRGKHAHKKCTQIFLPIKGKSEIKLTKKFTKKYQLDPKHLKLWSNQYLPRFFCAKGDQSSNLNNF